LNTAGLRHYAVKPPKRGEFVATVADVLSPPRTSRRPFLMAQPVHGNAEPLAINRPLRILLPDGSPHNRMLIRAYLKKTAYILLEAENGKTAVDQFIRDKFDLILMDIQMPVLDGYGAVRAIRDFESQHQRRRTPIIALTASALDDAVRRAL